MNKTYQIKFRFKDKGIQTVIKSENEVKEVNVENNIMDFINGFRV